MFGCVLMFPNVIECVSNAFNVLEGLLTCGTAQDRAQLT